MHASEPAALGLTESLDRLAAGDPAARVRLVDLCGMRILAHANRVLSAFPGSGQCSADDELIVSAARRLHAALVALDRAPPRLALALAAAMLKHVILEIVATRIAAAPAAGPAPAADHDSNRPRWVMFFGGVDRLPPLHRQVFHLVWFMGADPATVSRLTGRSPREVRRCWREARTTLARAVNPAPGSPHDDSCSFSAVA